MSVTRRAIDAATRVASDLGCRVADPRVLSDGSNVLVHLRPAPVVARVATATALIRPDPAAWLARDIDMARYLHGKGMPVVQPCTDPPAGPHHHDGLEIAFWQYLPHDPDHHLDIVEVARLLADLHVALRAYPGELPADGPLGDIRGVLDLLERHGTLTAAELAVLRADTDRLCQALATSARQPLHGDAHPGNVLSTLDGPMWIDFEETWNGPLAWDLASLADTGSLAGHSTAALAAYPDRPPADELETCLRLRRLFGVCWRFLMIHRYPEGEPNARRHLRAWLELPR